VNTASGPLITNHHLRLRFHIVPYVTDSPGAGQGGTNTGLLSQANGAIEAKANRADHGGQRALLGPHQHDLR